MNPIIDKTQMSEEDIKLNYITPAIQAKGWRGYITMETKITAGKVNLRGNIVVREQPKKVDYLLYIRENQPIAVVEAKKNDKSVSFGLQQAKEYAEKLGICGFHGRIAYFQCGFSPEIKAVKSSGSDFTRLTSARKPLHFNGFRALCYYSFRRFATLLQHGTMRTRFAAAGIVSDGFIIILKLMPIELC